MEKGMDSARGNFFGACLGPASPAFQSLTFYTQLALKTEGGQLPVLSLPS